MLFPFNFKGKIGVVKGLFRYYLNIGFSGGNTTKHPEQGRVTTICPTQLIRHIADSHICSPECFMKKYGVMHFP